MPADREERFFNGITLTIVIGCLFIFSIVSFAEEVKQEEDKRCEKFYQKEEQLRNASIDECQKDEDCVEGNIGTCGSCYNQRTPKEVTQEFLAVRTEATKVFCHPDVECQKYSCQCFEGRCQSKPIKLEE